MSAVQNRTMPDWLQVDEQAGVLTIHGKRYAVDLFGPKGFLAPAGTVLRIELGPGDVVTCTTLPQPREQRKAEPMVIAAAREQCRLYAKACNINADDLWNLESESFKADAEKVLAAVGAPTLLEAALAGAAYRVALAQCANDPQRMASFCTATGDDLDTLFEKWDRLSKEAIAKAGGAA